MTIIEFSRNLKATGEQTAELMRRQMPAIAGQMAVSHFRENFHKSGFVNNSFHPWQKAKREGNKKGAAGEYKTLLSGSANLYNQVKYIPGDYSVLIKNYAPYAAIHNEGGIIPVTDKMKRYGWYKFYLTLGHKKGDKMPKSIPEEAEQWRRLALTKKSKIIMPKRQFIGESKELNDKLTNKLDLELEKIWNL